SHAEAIRRRHWRTLDTQHREVTTSNPEEPRTCSSTSSPAPDGAARGFSARTSIRRARPLFREYGLSIGARTSTPPGLSSADLLLARRPHLGFHPTRADRAKRLKSRHVRRFGHAHVCHADQVHRTGS